MSKSSVVRSVARLGLVLAVLPMVVGVGIATAQTTAAIEAPAMLTAVNLNFVSLGALLALLIACIVASD